MAECECGEARLDAAATIGAEDGSTTEQHETMKHKDNDDFQLAFAGKNQYHYPNVPGSLA